MYRRITASAALLVPLLAGFWCRASGCSIDPPVPASGHPVTVIYDPAGGPLAGAAAVYVHRSYNNWTGAIDDPAMTLSNGLWRITYIAPQRAWQLDYVFHNGSGTWDNNGGSDWHFPVPLPEIGSPPPLPDNASRAQVMMQGFYWNCPGNWYNTIAGRAKNLRYMRGGQGIDRLWFPPPQKAASSWTSMGYDPYDYYDVGQYNQKGNTSTRFGTQTALVNATSVLRAKGIASMADLVLNHRDGGAAEANPNISGYSWTDFSGVASGMCTWHYNQFHPSTFETADEGVFGGLPDVCHVTGNSAGDAYYDLIAWGAWLTNSANAGFGGGWRFDFPKGINPSFVADFRKGTGDAYGILEYWDTNISLIEDYVHYSGNTSAFDFPAYYTMVDVFNHGAHIARLIDNTRVFAAKTPSRAVTFVSNHDTDKDEFVESIGNKMLAYAYILTYQGYPCLFWKDYYEYGLSTLGGQSGNGIQPLVWVRGALGGGQPAIQLLKVDDNDLLVYGTLNGSVDAPGYLVVLNTHASSPQSATVTTANTFLRGKTLTCHAWYSYATGQNAQPPDRACSASGAVTLEAPAQGYAVYSVSTALPDPWTATDIGSGGLAGSAIHVSDRFTLTGTGVNIEGDSDGFTYVYREIDGDFGIQARVVGMEHPDAWAKTGVMIREDTTTNSAHASVVVTPENGVLFQWRSAADAGTETVSVGGVSAPCWVRMLRSGDSFAGYYSLDGTAWIQIGTGQSFAMSASASAGLASASGLADALNTCSLDGVSVNHGPVSGILSNQVLIAGNILALTNSVSDADLPPQLLTQSLVEAPSGADFDPATGIFTWRPLVEQSPSTQTVSIAVSDDGLPPMVTTNRFAVTVIEPAMPEIVGSGFTNGTFGFWVDGDSGPDYTVMRSTNLMEETWLPVYQTNAPSLPFFWSAATSAVEYAEFFRIELGP